MSALIDLLMLIMKVSDYNDDVHDKGLPDDVSCRHAWFSQLCTFLEKMFHKIMYYKKTFPTLVYIA
jgi:hypothetical protein